MLWGEGGGEGEQDAHNPMLSMFQKGKVPQTTPDPATEQGVRLRGTLLALLAGPRAGLCGPMALFQKMRTKVLRTPAVPPDGAAEEGRASRWPGPSAQGHRSDHDPDAKGPDLGHGRRSITR